MALESVPRLEPAAATTDGPTVRITSPIGDPDVVLYFKSDERAQTACNAIRNYLDVVDVDSVHESVMRMLSIVFGYSDSSSS